MLSRLSLASKLLLLLLPFSAALIGLASVLAVDRFQTLSELQRSDRLIQVAARSSQLIHDLQTERGLSNGFSAATPPACRRPCNRRARSATRTWPPSATRRPIMPPAAWLAICPP